MLAARLVSVSALLLAVGFVSSPASALTMKECSAKYQAAQSAETLNGMKWNDFRKAQCGADASASPTVAPAAAPAVPAAPASAPLAVSAAKPPATTTRAAAPSAPPPAATGSVVYPQAVSPKYASESAGKARMHTCLDQYNENKTTNGNGGLTWIQKGGGYYSLCNKKLKG